MAADFAEAHRRLLADKSLQFEFASPRPPPKPPGWLQAMADFIEAMGPVLKLLFWAGLIAAVALIAFFIAREILAARWGGRGKAGRRGQAAFEWRPDPAAARLLLEEVDRLAAEGRYAEAAHHLLLHSIQDLGDRRPLAVRPSLTSRDIARMEVLPAEARAAFSAIAAVVERSLFGGRAVDGSDFAECRRAYEAFALPAAWS